MSAGRGMRDAGRDGMTRLQQVALTTLVAGYLLVVMSGVARLGTPSSALDLLHWSLVTGVAVLSATTLLVAWRERPASGIARALAALAAILFTAEALIEIGLRRSELPPIAVAIQLGLAEAFLATLALLTLAAFRPRITQAAGGALGERLTSLGRLSIVAAGAVFVLMVSGAFTSTTGPDAGCSEWPLCDGRLLPTGLTELDIHLIHRASTLLATVLVVAVAVRVRRVRADSPALVGLATAAATLMIVQIFVGALGIWLDFGAILGIAHLALATIIWGLLVTIPVVDRLLPVRAVEPVAEALPWRARSRRVFADYFTLTKPGVLTLLLITTLCAMLIAQAGLPPLGLVLWTLIGGALSAGGAAALNHYMDRDIDAIMSRTRERPLPSGRIPPVHVPIFGVTLSVLAVYVLTVFVNPLAALLALAGNLFYVFVYTGFLKRATPQNIVIGGAAGAVPPIVGWAAVTGNVGLPALLMFGVIFYWTPPHFWALALFKKTDYSVANVPMFPAVYGEEETRRHILLYTVMLVIVSLFFFPLQIMGLFYLISALVLGGLFLAKSIQLARQPDQQDRLARSLFFYSLWYLALLFAAMVADRVIWG